jgi:hypothetical protein
MSKLLDFSKYPEWHTDFVSHIEPVNTAQLSHFLGPGDELKCDIYGTKFNAVIKVIRTGKKDSIGYKQLFELNKR